jgi:hypothetical protein
MGEGFIAGDKITNPPSSDFHDNTNPPEITIQEKGKKQIQSVDYGWNEDRTIFSVVDKDTRIEHQFTGAWFSKMGRMDADPSIITETVIITEHR